MRYRGPKSPEYFDRIDKRLEDQIKNLTQGSIEAQGLFSFLYSYISVAAGAASVYLPEQFGVAAKSGLAIGAGIAAVAALTEGVKFVRNRFDGEIWNAKKPMHEKLIDFSGNEPS